MTLDTLLAGTSGIRQKARSAPANVNQVFIIGADRLSTELHNINEDANASLPDRLSLDYALNDPADPESLYTRDHLPQTGARAEAGL